MLQAPRAPYVQFEIKAEAFTDAEGHTQYRNKYFATITPAGGKDSLYKEADDWINGLLQKAQAAYSPDDAEMYRQWHDRFTTMLKRFKAGQEMTVDGTPLRACLAFTPAEVAAAESMRIFTLEELAAMNEQGIGNIGIGGRAMKTKAAKILEQQKDGRVAEENAALQMKLSEAMTRLDEAMQRIDALEADDDKPRRGRPPKAA